MKHAAAPHQYASRAERNGHRRPRSAGRVPSAGRMRRTARILRRVVIFALLAAVVVSLHTVNNEPRADQGAEPSAAETARQEALAEVELLRSQVTGPPADAPGPVRAQWSSSSDMLAVQADLLALPLPETSAAPSGRAGEPDSGPTRAEAATTPGLVAFLAEASARNLAHAENIDPGMARLLASVGAGQLVQAVALADAAGIEQPRTPSTARFTLRTGPACAGESLPGAEQQNDGGTPPEEAFPDTADALRSSVSALQRTVYAYEVITTRFAEPRFSIARERLGEHRTTLKSAVDLAAAHCISIPLEAAGYVLPDGSTDSPEEYLAVVESQLTSVCADLAGLSGENIRALAIDCLLDAALEAYAWDGATPASPGLPDAEPAPSTTSTAAPTVPGGS